MQIVRLQIQWILMVFLCGSISEVLARMEGSKCVENICCVVFLCGRVQMYEASKECGGQRLPQAGGPIAPPPASETVWHRRPSV